jgi:hypothetical protein
MEPFVRAGVVAGVAISAGWWDQAGAVLISVTGANTTDGMRPSLGLVANVRESGSGLHLQID